MRILLVEDQPGIAKAICKGLEKAHYTVTIAADGVAGLELATDELFALVILDVMLPRLNGWEVCRRLRDQGNPVPILMLTARDSVEDRVMGPEPRGGRLPAEAVLLFRAAGARPGAPAPGAEK